MENKSTIELLRDLELSLVNPYVRKSREELVHLLADEFVEFGSSGKVYDKSSTIDAMLEVNYGEIFLSKFKAVFPVPEIALVTYEAEIRDGKTKHVRRSLRSSLWKFDGSDWKIFFHQGTYL